MHDLHVILTTIISFSDNVFEHVPFQSRKHIGLVCIGSIYIQAALLSLPDGGDERLLVSLSTACCETLTLVLKSSKI